MPVRKVGIALPSMEAFLGHSTGGGGGNKFLDNWKKRKPPQVDTFMHCHVAMTAIWQFSWPRLVERDSKSGKGKTLEVWGLDFNSWEPEDVLKRQRFHDKETGEREAPPTICPMALMLEEIWQAIYRGDVQVQDELFRYEGDDPQQTKVLHAGGVVGLFNEKYLSEAQLKAIKKAGISLKNAWRENAMAKCNYIVQVVDNDAVEKGIQVATIGTALGDAIKSLINKRIVAKKERGNPLKHPYCIRWMYLPDESMSDMYDAVWMEEIEPSKEVLKLIQDTEPVDISRQLEAGNITELRQSVEANYTGPKGLLDWDAIFGPAEREMEGTGDDDAQADDKPATSTRRESTRTTVRDKDDDDEPTPARASGGRAARRDQADEERPKRGRKAEPEPEPEDDDDEDDDEQTESDAAGDDEEILECDACNGPMKLSDPKCPKCGQEYDEQGKMIPKKEPEPARRTRSQVAAAAKDKDESPADGKTRRRVNF